MQTLIIAHERRHAEYAAKMLLNIPLSQMRFIDQHEQLRGLARGTEIVVVQAPRYAPTQWQRDTRRMLIEVGQIREFKFKHVSLK